jgi:hypothetical protein
MSWTKPSGSVPAAVDYVDKILRGAKTGNIPVEQPTKFDLVVNLTTAKALGLAFPPTLLSRADEVVDSANDEAPRLHPSHCRSIAW